MRTQKSGTRKQSLGGVAQVAVWKDRLDQADGLDLFQGVSQDCFYDFVKPLRVLEGHQWSRAIRAQSEPDYFVFTPAP